MGVSVGVGDAGNGVLVGCRVADGSGVSVGDGRVDVAEGIGEGVLVIRAATAVSVGGGFGVLVDIALLVLSNQDEGRGY